MNSIEERERSAKFLEDAARTFFWFERLLLFVILLVSSRGVFLLVVCPLLVSTTFFALVFPWLCRRNSSADRSGITTCRIWLFLFDRFMFLAALGAYNAVWLLRLTIIIAVAVHYVYIIQYLDISYKTHHAEPRGIDDESSEEGDVSKEVEETRELLEYLKEDGKKMDTEMENIDHLINPDLETHRRNLSVKLLALRKEMRDVGGKIKTYKELMSSVVNSEVSIIRSKVGEEIEASTEGPSSLADQVHKAYFAIQETEKAARTTSDRAYLISLFAQEISAQIRNKRWMRRLDVEGLPELREEVRRMSLQFAARRMEAKVTADRAAQELSNARVKLMEAVGIRQWEEYKLD
ncbi:hypothetical protein HA466_0064370 [Hirschfeldia incana]|nr:hypothetical protein HA466_0064370 [Hirschfeldia incana]